LKNISDIRSFSCPSSIGIDYLFPLYLYFDLDNSRQPNFSPTIVKKFAKGLELKFVPEKTGDPGTFAPIDVLDYIYAALHSPKYIEKYKEFLKIDFPRVPYPVKKETFWKLVELGGKLRKIHLLESDELGILPTNYPISGNNIVAKIKYIDEKVYINDSQYFNEVPEISWKSYIGGYQPAQKWLKDRRGRQLDYDDIVHYQRIINALYLTDQIMKEIDARIFF
jgi:predicted helicase